MDKELRERNAREEALLREREEIAQRRAKEERNRLAVAEGERQRLAEERRRLNNDPSIAAALVRIDAEEKAEQRRAAEAEQRRYEAGRVELEQEVDRRLALWMASGGSPETFPRADVQREILMKRQQDRLRQQDQASVF